VVAEVTQTAEFTVLVKKTHVPVKVDCYRDDKLIKIDGVKYRLEHNEVDYSYKLVVANLTPQDAGRFSFTVSNPYGKASAGAQLNVKCNFFYF
jgi:hypothetical protein